MSHRAFRSERQPGLRPLVSVPERRARKLPCALDAASSQVCRPSDDQRLIRLLERAGRHDQAAFGLFYDATCNVVFGMVLSVVTDRARAETVAEAVYVEAWRLAPTYDADLGTPTGWLAAITGRRLTDPCSRHGSPPPLS
jgi:hypothetical protein